MIVDSYHIQSQPLPFYWERLCMSAAEDENLLGGTPKGRESLESGNQTFKVYFGRYYVLLVTALLCMHQCLAWLTFGPIPQAARDRYGLTDVELTLLPEYSPIEFLLLTIPFTWFLHRFGLRVVGVGGAWMLAVGCGIRVFIPFMPQANTWIWVMHVGHILIGLVGLPAMLMPSKVSATWFPVHQRSFATAIAANAQGFGSGFGFLLISFLTEQYGIRTMLYVQAEIALFIALLATIYFPSKPLTPPSYTASEERSHFLKSLKQLITNTNFILLVLSGGLSVGAVSAFSSVLGIILNPTSGFNNLVMVHSVDEFFYSIAWLGATSQLAGTIVGQFTGHLADKFQRKFKLILLLFLGLSTGFSLWFCLSLYGYGSSNPINYFISFSLVNIFTQASFPIYYEAVVESTYPVPEETSTGGLALLVNGATLMSAIIGMAGVFSETDPERAKIMTWVLTGLTALAFVLIFLVKEKYTRLDKDAGSVSSSAEKQSPYSGQNPSIQSGVKNTL